MARINPALLDRLMTKLGVKRGQVYKLIDRKVRETHLPRNQAAIALASERGIGISRFSTEDDLAAMRQAAAGAAPRPAVSASPNTIPNARFVWEPVRRGSPRRSIFGNQVFVVHGRDTRLRDELYDLLRALGLKPLEWGQAIRLTKKGTPYVGEILEKAFNRAAAVVVLLTPDDEARLRAALLKAGDSPYERALTGQARANVLFEAGMAFGKNPRSTVLVQVGQIRPFSDVGGRHVVHLGNDASSRQELATKLQAAGCSIDRSGTHWLTAGDFSKQLPPIRARRKKPRRKPGPSGKKRRRR